MATRETAAQRRARENKGVSARNNPFKQQDVKAKAAAPKFVPGGGGATATAGKVDAATSNIEKLLKWIQKRVNQYAAVDVTNFTTSWEDGLALCALMNYLKGDEAIDPVAVTEADKLTRFTMAIKVASDNGVPELLAAEDLAVGRIDRKSMITYLHAVYTEMFAKKKAEEDKAKAEAAE